MILHFSLQGQKTKIQESKTDLGTRIDISGKEMNFVYKRHGLNEHPSQTLTGSFSVLTLIPEYSTELHSNTLRF